MYSPWLGIHARPISPFYDSILADKAIRNADRQNAILSRQVFDLARQNVDLKTRIIQMNAQVYAEQLINGTNPDPGKKSMRKDEISIGYSKDALQTKQRQKQRQREKGREKQRQRERYLKSMQKQRQKQSQLTAQKNVGKLYHIQNRNNANPQREQKKYTSLDRLYSFSNPKNNNNMNKSSNYHSNSVSVNYPSAKTNNINSFQSYNSARPRTLEKRLQFTQPSAVQNQRIVTRYESQAQLRPRPEQPIQGQRQPSKSKLQVTQKKEQKFNYLRDLQKERDGEYGGKSLQQIKNEYHLIEEDVRRKQEIQREKEQTRKQLQQHLKQLQEIQKQKQIQIQALKYNQNERNKNTSSKLNGTQLNRNTNTNNMNNSKPAEIIRIQSEVYNQLAPNSNTNNADNTTYDNNTNNSKNLNNNSTNNNNNNANSSSIYRKQPVVTEQEPEPKKTQPPEQRNIGNDRTSAKKPNGDNQEPQYIDTYIKNNQAYMPNDQKRDNRIYLINSTINQSPERTYSPISKLKSIKRFNDSVYQSNIQHNTEPINNIQNIQNRQSQSPRKTFLSVTSRKEVSPNSNRTSLPNFSNKV